VPDVLKDDISIRRRIESYGLLVIGPLISDVSFYVRWCSTAGFTLLDLDPSKPVLTVDHVESIISQDRELPRTEVYPSARPTSPVTMLTFYAFFVVNSRRGFGLSCDDISKKERTNVSSITLHQSSLALVFSSPQLSRILTEYYADYPRPPAQWLRQTPQVTEH
jgi:hypothetical protein